MRKEFDYRKLFDASNRQRILLSPLDWGLGHAVRCMPIINYIKKETHHVLVLAAEGRSYELLRKTYPDIHIIKLQSKPIIYSKSGSLIRVLFCQIPKIIDQVFFYDRLVCKRIVRQLGITMVISDNRYGFRNSAVKNIFITHQLFIRLPKPIRFLQFFLHKMVHILIKKFDVCIVPDNFPPFDLSGELAHKKTLKNIEYIGVLSRFKPVEVEKEYFFAAIISGPEPQRQIFEEMVINQFKRINKKCLIVGGKTECSDYKKISENIEYYAQLSQKELNRKLCASQNVVSRSGYTSIMDYQKLGLNAILIPTPGQTEQEYLAKYLSSRGVCTTISQKEFDKVNLSQIAYTHKKAKL